MSEPTIKTRYVIRAQVVKVEERFENRNYHQDEKGNWTHDSISLGWFVSFDGSWEAVYFGHEKPILVEGQMTTHTIEGV